MKRIGMTATAIAALALAGCDQIESAKLQRKAEKAVAAQLRDPDSAKFTDVVVNGSQVCGRVNGKNAFGAYAGAQKFVWHSGDAQIANPDATDSAEIVRSCMTEKTWAQCQARVSVIDQAEQIVAGNEATKKSGKPDDCLQRGLDVIYQGGE